MTLSGGMNNFHLESSDIAGNTGSQDFEIIRLPEIQNAQLTKASTGQIKISFQTDLVSTGVILYGTGQNSLTHTIYTSP